MSLQGMHGIAGILNLDGRVPALVVRTYLWLIGGFPFLAGDFA
jgi:hypothetical protein